MKLSVEKQHEIEMKLPKNDRNEYLNISLTYLN